MKAAIVHCNSWSDRALALARARYPEVEWQIATAPTGWAMSDLDFAFFLHWGAKVDLPATGRPVCVGFHLGRLPSERGGSPLQHRILAGQTTATLTAFRMTDEIDAGPIYSESAVWIGSDSAKECYLRADDTAVMMIGPILAGAQPVPQPSALGPPFRRRTPAESALPVGIDLRGLYDFVRMLDADGYPHAFVQRGRLRLELTTANRYDDRVEIRIVAREAP